MDNQTHGAKVMCQKGNSPEQDMPGLFFFLSGQSPPRFQFSSSIIWRGAPIRHFYGESESIRKDIPGLRLQNYCLISFLSYLKKKGIASNEQGKLC